MRARKMNATTTISTHSNNNIHQSMPAVVMAAAIINRDRHLVITWLESLVEVTEISKIKGEEGAKGQEGLKALIKTVSQGQLLLTISLNRRQLIWVKIPSNSKKVLKFKT